MPLTRRVQVFIDEEASAALDELALRAGTQTAAIEYALLKAVGRYRWVEGADEGELEALGRPHTRQPDSPDKWTVAEIAAVKGKAKELAEVFPPDAEVDPILEQSAVEARAKRKAARKDRKGKLQKDTQEFLGKVRAELGDDVANALATPENPILAQSPAVIGLQQMGYTVVDVTPEKLSCPHPARDRVGPKGNQKCTACGEKI